MRTVFSQLSLRKSVSTAVAALFAAGAVLLLPGTSEAVNIQIGERYEVGGSPQFFNLLDTSQTAPLLEGSSMLFDAQGLFHLTLVTAAGSASLELGYDLADLADGGDVRLRPATQQDVNSIINHLNNGNQSYVRELDTNMDGVITPLDALINITDLKSGATSAVWKQGGIFTSADELAAFTFVALMSDAVFRLGDNSLTIANGQFAANGALLGRTEFQLTAVPEPASMLLFGSALLGGLMRKSGRRAESKSGCC